MADLTQNTQITQSAAPGSLLRTTAEAQQNDPSKVSPDAAVNSPIRNLTVNPLQSTLPPGTPRVMNVVGPQSPTIDYSGLHALLANAPVPPAHVAAGLIRALMTPGSGVIQPKAYVPPAAPPAPAAPHGAPSPASSAPQAVSPASASTPNYSRPASQPVFQQRFGAPTGTGSLTPYNYSPAPQQHSAPQTHQNTVGSTPFISGNLLNGISNFVKNGAAFVGNGLGRANSWDEELAPALEQFLGFLQ